MPPTTDAAAMPAVLPLTPAQRIALRDLLASTWREQVVRITDLAIRFHTREEPELARELARLRRRLVDVEAALDRLDSRSYGRCDGCERRIPFEQLEADPELRFCRRCYPG